MRFKALLLVSLSFGSCLTVRQACRRKAICEGAQDVEAVCTDEIEWLRQKQASPNADIESRYVRFVSCVLRTGRFCTQDSRSNWLSEAAPQAACEREWRDFTAALPQ